MPAAQGEDVPASLVRGIAFPKEGSLPTLVGHGVPPFGKPKLGTRVCVVRHKVQVLAACHSPAGDLKGFQIHPVTGSFVIKAKVQRVSGVRRITDFNQSTAKVMPYKLRG